MPAATEPQATASDGPPICFGPFRLLPMQRLLLEGDQPVRLGSRAFDILATLVERPGEVIGRDELKSRTWPKTFVEDTNLKIQVSALRRALTSDGAARVGRRCGPPGSIREARTVMSGAVLETPALVAGFENVAVVGETVE